MLEPGGSIITEVKFWLFHDPWLRDVDILWLFRQSRINHTPPLLIKPRNRLSIKCREQEKNLPKSLLEKNWWENATAFFDEAPRRPL
jgi:hypothetical protein